MYSCMCVFMSYVISLGIYVCLSLLTFGLQMALYVGMYPSLVVSLCVSSDRPFCIDVYRSFALEGFCVCVLSSFLRSLGRSSFI